MTGWLSYVSFHLSLWSGWCFVNTGIYLLKFSTVVSENGLWNVVLTMLCGHWARKCLMGCLLFGPTWNCVWVCVFFYCSVVSVIPSLLQDLTAVWIFFVWFNFERHWRHFTVQRHLLRTCLTHCLSRENLFNALFISLIWNWLKFKRVICL